MDMNFWKRKPLSDFSEEEWEAVCMRCGKCCLFKEEKSNRVYFTNCMCDGYDFATGNCKRYACRLGAECLKVDLRLLITEPELLPETCAYRLLLAGKELPDYHPLVSGDANSVHKAGKTVLEMPDVYSVDELMHFINQHAVFVDPDDLSEEKTAALKEEVRRFETVYLESYEIPDKN